MQTGSSRSSSSSSSSSSPSSSPGAESPSGSATDAQRTILTLVRHGQTSANLDAVWHGSSDTALTTHGEQQAEHVAAFLVEHSADARSLYTSPLIRAQNTAAPIAARLGLTPRVEEDLREYDIGSWEGKSFKELQEVHGLWKHIATDPDYAPHGGESPRQVVARMTTRLRAIGAAHPGERVIVVTHGGALSLALGHLMQGARFVHLMQNCAVSELALDPTPELLSFDLHDHLPDERAGNAAGEA